MATGVPQRVVGWVRTSSVPYLAVVVGSVLLARYMPYLVREDVTIKGQPLYIAVELILFPAAIVLWLLYRGTRTRSPWLVSFLVAMILAWGVRLVLMIVHGDNFNHLAWLTPVFLLMLLFKTPPWRDAWTGVVIVAWALAIILLSAYLFEVTGFYEALFLPEEIREFQQREYWLPLDGFLGIEGRWTGPLGHNTRTGLAAAIVFLVGCARWGKNTIPLVAIGTYMLLVTSVRASYLAAFVGVLILVVFSRRGVLARIPVWVRWTLLGGAAAAAALGMTITGAGLTGRQTIWPAFWELIPQSPLIGVGATGILEAGGVAAFRVDAHNIFLDELVRFGVVGLIVMVTALAIGTVITYRAASRGFAAGAAIVTAYLVASLTDIQNDWIQLYYHSVFVILSVVAAGQWLGEQSETAPEPAAAGTQADAAVQP
jgi:O-antigen ligase